MERNGICDGTSGMDKIFKAFRGFSLQGRDLVCVHCWNDVNANYTVYVIVYDRSLDDMLESMYFAAVNHIHGE
jgi:hypothetical protein